MKRIGAFFAAAAALVACSSDDEAECTIVGTYTMTATPETQSAGCAALGTDPSTATVTITADGAGYLVEIGGSQGGCPATKSGTCQIQAKCDVTVTDAIDPQNNLGTLQLSWTFTEDGYTGLNSGDFPAARSLPGGCDFTSAATGTRR